MSDEDPEAIWNELLGSDSDTDDYIPPVIKDSEGDTEQDSETEPYAHFPIKVDNASTGSPSRLLPTGIDIRSSSSGVPALQQLENISARPKQISSQKNPHVSWSRFDLTQKSDNSDDYNLSGSETESLPENNIKLSSVKSKNTAKINNNEYNNVENMESSEANIGKDKPVTDTTEKQEIINNPEADLKSKPTDQSTNTLSEVNQPSQSQSTQTANSEQKISQKQPPKGLAPPPTQKPPPPPSQRPPPLPSHKPPPPSLQKPPPPPSLQKPPPPPSLQKPPPPPSQKPPPPPLQKPPPPPSQKLPPPPSQKPPPPPSQKPPPPPSQKLPPPPSQKPPPPPSQKPPPPPSQKPPPPPLQKPPPPPSQKPPPPPSQKPPPPPSQKPPPPPSQKPPPPPSQKPPPPSDDQKHRKRPQHSNSEPAPWPMPRSPPPHPAEAPDSPSPPKPKTRPRSATYQLVAAPTVVETLDDVLTFPLAQQPRNQSMSFVVDARPPSPAASPSAPSSPSSPASPGQRGKRSPAKPPSPRRRPLGPRLESVLPAEEAAAVRTRVQREAERRYAQLVRRFPLLAENEAAIRRADPTAGDADGHWRAMPESLAGSDLRRRLDELEHKIAVVRGQVRELEDENMELNEDYRRVQARMNRQRMRE